MYPETPRSPRRKFFIIVGILFVLGLVITLVLLTSRKAENRSLNSNLTEYSDADFSIKYPKDFSPSLVNDTETRFSSPTTTTPTEYISVSYESAEASQITPQTIEYFKKQAAEDPQTTFEESEQRGQKHVNIKRADDSGVVTETTYIFYPDYVWKLVLSYAKDSSLASSATIITESFIPKEKQTIPDQDQSVPADAIEAE